MLIGLSVSFCIKDIIEGRKHLSDLDCIVAGTKIKDVDGLIRVADSYADTYWRKDPDVAKGILFWLYFNDKIYQPRLIDIEPPNIAQGHWIALPEKGVKYV